MAGAVSLLCEQLLMTCKGRSAVRSRSVYHGRDGCANCCVVLTLSPLISVCMICSVRYINCSLEAVCTNKDNDHPFVSSVSCASSAAARALFLIITGRPQGQSTWAGPLAPRRPRGRPEHQEVRAPFAIINPETEAPLPWKPVPLPPTPSAHDLRPHSGRPAARPQVSSAGRPADGAPVVPVPRSCPSWSWADFRDACGLRPALSTCVQLVSESCWACCDSPRRWLCPQRALGNVLRQFWSSCLETSARASSWKGPKTRDAVNVLHPAGHPQRGQTQPRWQRCQH